MIDTLNMKEAKKGKFADFALARIEQIRDNLQPLVARGDLHSFDIYDMDMIVLHFKHSSLQIHISGEAPDYQYLFTHEHKREKETRPGRFIGRLLSR